MFNYSFNYTLCTWAYIIKLAQGWDWKTWDIKDSSEIDESNVFAFHNWAPEFASLSLHVALVVDEPEFFPSAIITFPCYKFHSTDFSIIHPVRPISPASVLVQQIYSTDTVVQRWHLVIGAPHHLIPRCIVFLLLFKKQALNYKSYAYLN